MQTQPLPELLFRTDVTKPTPRNQPERTPYLSGATQPASPTAVQETHSIGPATITLLGVPSSPPSTRRSLSELESVIYPSRAALSRSIQIRAPGLSRVWTYPPSAQSFQVPRPAVVAESPTGHDRTPGLLAYIPPLGAAPQPASSTGVQEPHSSGPATHCLSGVSSSPPSTHSNINHEDLNTGTPTPPLSAAAQPATSIGVQETHSPGLATHNLSGAQSSPPSTHSNIHHGDVVVNIGNSSNSENHQAGARLSLKKMLLSLKMSPVLKYSFQVIFLGLTCVGVWQSSKKS